MIHYLKVSLIALVLLAGIHACSRRPATDEPKVASIQLDSILARMGTLSKEQGPAQTVFTFKNTGTEKLVILDAAVSCDCLSVTLPEKPVKPGKKGQFVVTMDPHAKKAGGFNYRVFFAYNGDPMQFYVDVEGEITEK